MGTTQHPKMDAVIFSQHIRERNCEHSWPLYLGIASKERLFSTTEGLDMEMKNANTKHKAPPQPKQAEEGYHQESKGLDPPPNCHVAPGRPFFSDTQFHYC